MSKWDRRIRYVGDVAPRSKPRQRMADSAKVSMVSPAKGTSTGTGAGSEAAAAAAAASSASPRPAGTPAGVTVSDLDRQIAALRRCEYLKESEVKAICSKAREILVDESNVQRVDAPVTVSIREESGAG